MSCRVLLTTVLMGGMLCATLPAAPIFGTFNLSGTITLAQTSPTLQTISWNSDVFPFLPNKASVASPTTGSFASPIDLAGTQLSIQNLNNVDEPVGTFPPHLFISFDANPSLPALDISQLFAGIFTSTQCGLAPAPGQTCTVAPNSPFSLLNTPNGGSTVSFAMSGLTSDGLSTWTGTFTSQFNVPFQTLLSTFNSLGSITNTYSATFTAAPVVPEAGTLALFGLGLMGISVKLRRRS